MKINQLQNHFTYLTESDLNLLRSISTFKTYSKKEVLIRPEKLNFDFFFVTKGILRGYIMDENGEEKNIFFGDENLFVGAPECILHQKPTKYYFETYKDLTEMFVFDVRTLEELSQYNPNIGRFYFEGLKAIISRLVNRIESFVTYQPEARLINFYLTNPLLSKRALKKQIADYLGIAPNSLSRIVSRLEKLKT